MHYNPISTQSNNLLDYTKKYNVLVLWLMHMLRQCKFIASVGSMGKFVPILTSNNQNKEQKKSTAIHMNNTSMGQLIRWPKLSPFMDHSRNLWCNTTNTEKHCTSRLHGPRIPTSDIRA